MALIRIPSQADIPTRLAFQDIESQLAQILARLDGKVDTASVQTAQKDIKDLQQAVAPKGPLPLDNATWPNGQAGSDGKLDEVLHEDLKWKDPLQGQVKVLTGPDLSLGGTQQGASLTQVSGNMTVLGKASVGTLEVAGSITTSGATVAGLFETHGGNVVNPNGILAAINCIVWYAPYACMVTAVKGYRVGGAGATVNARLNGSSNHLASDLSLTSTDTWMDGGAVQNTVYAAGDKLEIMVTGVTTSPTQVAVSVTFVRT